MHVYWKILVTSLQLDMYNPYCLFILFFAFMEPVNNAFDPELFQDGISCELVDLKTLIPWDKETVEASVRKTGRVLVCILCSQRLYLSIWLVCSVNQLLSSVQISHEAPVTGGFGAEISASIVERCFLRVSTKFLQISFVYIFKPRATC